MKNLILYLFIAIGGIVNAQDWTPWKDVGHGIQISFRFGRESCKFANTYARMRNVSNHKYCWVSVGFDQNCSGQPRTSIDARNLEPNHIKESAGDFYITSLNVSNIRLEKLQNAECVSILGKQQVFSNPKSDYTSPAGQTDNVKHNMDEQKLLYERLVQQEQQQALKEESQRLNKEKKQTQLRVNAQHENLRKDQLSMEQKTQENFDHKQKEQQQIQQEINNAQSATMTVYEAALNSGRETSGAMLEATVSGTQYINDPKTSLEYAIIGLGITGLIALSEQKEARFLGRQEELKNFKRSLSTSTSLFNFMRGTTEYHITKIECEMKKNGRIKNVIRTDLYDVSVNLHQIINSIDEIVLFESISFKNIISLKDSVVISKIVIPITKIMNAEAYNGRYTNRFDYKTKSYKHYRYKELSNSTIEYAFSMQGNYPEMPSGLTDVYVKTDGNHIQIQKKYVKKCPYILNDANFNDTYSYKVNSYFFVFNDYNDRIHDFVDYLNFIKGY